MESNRIEQKRRETGRMHHSELDGNWENLLETTVLYKTWAQLTPTLTHVVTYELVTSGAEDRAMSIWDSQIVL